MTFINTSTGAISLRACETAQRVEALAARTDRVEGENRFLPDLHTYVGVCDRPPVTTPTDGDDGEDGEDGDDGAGAKCNKHNSLSLQKETKH